MTTKIFIKPAVSGHIIRHPEKMKHIISQDGEWVVDSPVWQRKLLQGDVVKAEPKVTETQMSRPVAKQKLNKEGDE